MEVFRNQKGQYNNTKERSCFTNKQQRSIPLSSLSSDQKNEDRNEEEKKKRTMGMMANHESERYLVEL